MTTKSDNRTVGGQFEQALAVRLAEDGGFWVHVMQQNKAGQPADIIAVKGRFHTLIDCKVCADGTFSFDRVEENQKFAMRMFTRKCGELCYFAFLLPSGMVRLINLERIETLKGRGKKRLNANELIDQTWSLEKWLNASDTWAEDS